MKKQKCKVSTKLEFYPKERLIVSADYNTTEKMRYVDTWLQKWMSGNTSSTLWQNEEDALKMWISFGTRNLKIWKCPMDQSAFDHHVSIKMILCAIDRIKALIDKKAYGVGKEDLLKVMDSIRYALDGGEVLYAEADGTTYKVIYKNGVLSGWQWTAFLDTLCNIAEKDIALDLLAEKGITMNPGTFNAQGDDQFAEYETAMQCIAYWAALTSFGFELHLQKNFFSNEHNEYLRKCSFDNTVNGYPARLVQSLLWLYPGQNMERDSLIRMKNIVSNWQKMSERLDIDIKSLKNYISQDCKGAKVDAKILEIYLTTAKVNGGSGIMGTETKYKIEKVEDKKQPVLIDGIGLTEFKLRFGEFQARELNSWALSVIGLPNQVKDKINNTVIELVDYGKTFVKEVPPIKEIPIYLATDVRIKMLKHKEGWNNSLVFGSSRDLANEIFPDFEGYASFKHAPRKWVFDMLTQKLKVNVPRIKGYSEEYSALLFNPYRQSVISAMCQKQTRGERKWDRIQLFVERNSHLFITTIGMPTMKG